MAHRIERRAVRRRGRPAHPGSGALRRAARRFLLTLLAGLLAGPASGQAPASNRADLLASSLPDLPAWWAEPGRPGFAPDAWWNASYPWTLAGHVRGAFALSDPFLPTPSPHPGLAGVYAPLAWLDSVAVRSGGTGAWGGFESGFVEVRGVAPAPRGEGGRRRARADLVVAGGSSAYDENALALARGDSAHWIRLGVASGGRGGVGALGSAGRHQYEGQASWIRGRQRFSGALAHRGSAASLAIGAEQAAGGLGGQLGYALGVGGYELGLEVGRAYDHHESFGLFLPYSRRDAARLDAQAILRGEGRPWSARLLVTDASVRRATPSDSSVESSATSVWLALGMEAARGPARLHAGVGVGRDGGSSRTEVAPSVSFEFVEGGYAGRLFAERVLASVWSDLAAGEEAFLQSTWMGGFDVRAGGTRGLSGALGWLMGRTRDRAVVTRYPFEELWLRAGYRRDPERFDFGLATVRGEWRGAALRLGVEAYQFLREAHAIQPAVDPRRGGRATVDWRFIAFQGDLGVRLTGEMDGVSGRESELGPAVWLPGYLSFGAGASLSLADANVAFRIRNLENEPRRQTWVDPATGLQALGPGVELRLVFAWRLNN